MVNSKHPISDSSIVSEELFWGFSIKVIGSTCMHYYALLSKWEPLWMSNSSQLQSCLKHVIKMDHCSIHASMPLWPASCQWSGRGAALWDKPVPTQSASVELHYSQALLCYSLRSCLQAVCTWSNERDHILTADGLLMWGTWIGEIQWNLPSASASVFNHKCSNEGPSFRKKEKNPFRIRRGFFRAICIPLSANGRGS